MRIPSWIFGIHCSCLWQPFSLRNPPISGSIWSRLRCSQNIALQGITPMRRIVEKHSGKVPDTMEELCALPCVGRKTANVVLGNAFHKNDGIVVDTHVIRLSQRLGLTKHKDPEKIERDLMKLVPREHWTDWSHWLIWHGRRRCYARKPDCSNCEVFRLWSSGKIFSANRRGKKAGRKGCLTRALRAFSRVDTARRTFIVLGSFSHVPELFFEIPKLFIGKVLEIDKLIARVFDRTNQFVQFEMHCFSVAVLCVLNQKDHQKRNDRRGRVDDQLPRIGEMKHRTGQEPDKDH